MERKEFIKTCGIACLGVTSISFILQSCISPSYITKARIENNQLIIKKTEFIIVDKGIQGERKFILVKAEKLDFPICIYKISESEFTALYMQCTHKGCELKPQGEYLICPCHGSEFTNTGAVQNPPAEENLRTFLTKSDNENIYIQL